MSLYYLDASAWVKRYVEEAGSDWMARFWSQRPSLACSRIGALKILAAVQRRLGHDDARSGPVIAALHTDRGALYEVSLSPGVIERAEDLVRRHRLRAADAIHLASAIIVGLELGQPVCLVASDSELLKAAAAEGMVTLDPQTNPAVPAFPDRPHTG